MYPRNNLQRFCYMGIILKLRTDDRECIEHACLCVGSQLIYVHAMRRKTLKNACVHSQTVPIFYSAFYLYLRTTCIWILYGTTMQKHRSITKNRIRTIFKIFYGVYFFSFWKMKFIFWIPQYWKILVNRAQTIFRLLHIKFLYIRLLK